MPIVDVEIVCASETEFVSPPAEALANSLGRVFGSPRGGTWVRVRFLSSTSYAENETEVPSDDLPVFVTVLQARPPFGEALLAEVKAVTLAVAASLARAEERVHVQYAPAAIGRQAFGGVLVK